MTPHYHPVIAATSYLYQELCECLIKMGHQVTIITGFPRYNVSEAPGKYRRKLWMRENINGVDVLRIRSVTLPRYVPIARGIEYFCVFITLFITALLSKRPDAALVHPSVLFDGLSGIWLRPVKRVPFVVNVHDLFPQTAIDLGLLKSKTFIRIFRFLEVYLYKNADWMTVHSEGNRDWVIAHGGHPERTTVMPVWMDSSVLKPGPRDNTWRTRQGLKDKFVILFAGTQGFNQDMEVILRAAGKLREYQDIEFVIIGDGAQHEEMVALSKEMALTNVRWLGWQPREEYPLVQHTADIVVVTLKKEVSTPVVPSKILSAMTTGRPIITTMPLSGDAPKLVQESKSGMTLPPGDSDQLKEAILELYYLRPLGEQYGANGRRYVEDHLDVKRWAVAYIDLFNMLIKERQKQSS
jgi:glycosyltransferase involved in cell wall biosynthesis